MRLFDGANYRRLGGGPFGRAAHRELSDRRRPTVAHHVRFQEGSTALRFHRGLKPVPLCQDQASATREGEVIRYLDGGAENMRFSYNPGSPPLLRLGGLLASSAYSALSVE